MAKVTKDRKDVQVGDVIWAWLKIPHDIVNSSKVRGTTSSRIAAGMKVRKFAVVKEVQEGRLVVYYITTFNGKPLAEVAREPEKWKASPFGTGWLYPEEIEVFDDQVEVIVLDNENAEETNEST